MLSRRTAKGDVFGRRALIGTVVFLCLVTMARGQEASTATTINVPSVGTPCQNGEALRQAVLGVTGASSSNRYEVVLAAGQYSLCGAVGDALAMKEWVDLVGLGRDSTFVSGPGAVVPSPDSEFHSGIPQGTFRGASNMTLRDLTLRTVSVGPTRNPTYNIVLSNYEGASPTVERVRLIARNGEVNVGIRNYDAQPVIRDVEILVTGGSLTYGLVSRYRSAPTLQDLSIEATAGAMGNYGVFTGASTDAAVIGTPEDWGSVVSAGIARNLDIVATGGNSAYGIFNDLDAHRVDASGTPWALIADSFVYGDTGAVDVADWATPALVLDLQITDSVFSSDGASFATISAVGMTGVVESSVVTAGAILISQGTCIDVVDENGAPFPPDCF